MQLVFDRIDPERTRAVVRAKLLRRLDIGAAFRVHDRIPVIADVAQIVAELVARRQQIGERSQSLEARAGLTEGHVAKIEAGTRVPGLDTFALLVRAMGGRVVIVWDAPADAKK